MSFSDNPAHKGSHWKITRYSGSNSDWNWIIESTAYPGQYLNVLKGHSHNKAWVGTWTDKSNLNSQWKLETLGLGGSGRWERVTCGNDAMNVEFSHKVEKMEGGSATNTVSRETGITATLEFPGAGNVAISGKRTLTQAYGRSWSQTLTDTTKVSMTCKTDGDNTPIKGRRCIWQWTMTLTPTFPGVGGGFKWRSKFLQCLKTGLRPRCPALMKFQDGHCVPIWDEICK